MRISALEGDITEQQVDAIVNAANNRMRGGGGVDGAIHRAGGREVLDDCIRRFPDGMPTGEAGWTTAGSLPATWIIHVVGPIHGIGKRSRLVSCYRNAMSVASGLGVRSIAFPLVSSGVYGWPLDDAVAAAIDGITAAAVAVDDVRIVTVGGHRHEEVIAQLAKRGH